MSLNLYHHKRHFNQTPEPRGKEADSRGPLRFVVQKHDASRLHYDFRLELDGTLKSWAVPKGPSLNPADKRLAMMVEDHPLDYRTFEGIIPEGNYGAGSVIVWDQGTYHAGDADDRNGSEKSLRAGLAKGHLTFVLEGEKLRGEFSLLKLRRGEENAWLLIKKQDEHASTEDVGKEDRSVISGLNLEEIAAGKSARTKKAAAKPKGVRRKKPKSTAMPHDIKPMLASLVEEAFDRDDWLFEIKWDGYRAIAEVTTDKVRLYSRNHKSFENRFAPIFTALGDLGHEAVLDGEVVVLDKDGRSQFQLLQYYQKSGIGNLQYFVFDLLYLDGRDLRSLPLRERKALLAGVLKDVPNVRVSEHIEKRGIDFFRAAAKQGLEGIIGKDGNSPYREGTRNLDWVKIKTSQRQEAVIGGFTAPRGSRAGLGALVLGVYEGDQLVYIGHTGGGLDTQGLEDLRERLDPLIQKECPFEKKPKTNAPVQWVKPRLVCEVRFQEWTGDGRMRQPIFVGLREDKPARQVKREKELPASKVADKKSGPTPTLTSLDKIYWPDDSYTKGDLIEYYRGIAPVILPYLRDRPMSMHRHPNGIDADSFFQKDVSKQPPPEWVETVVVPADDGKKRVEYVLCQNEETLLYLANLGCIEMNPWTSHVPTLDRPDFLVIDLDPEAITFEKVVEAALTLRKVLDKAEIECLCKTSGKRALHICVPLGAKYDHDVARQFAELLATQVNAVIPETTSLERRPVNRQRKVYLDYLQNRRGQTLAAPYSVRPAPGATVSTPLKWTEVKKSLDASRFTIRTILKRIEKVGDLWKPMDGRGVDLQQGLKKLTRS
jgi:bifunctional non-homologous end joining protein LigD